MTRLQHIIGGCALSLLFNFVKAQGFIDNENSIPYNCTITGYFTPIASSNCTTVGISQTHLGQIWIGSQQSEKQKQLESWDRNPWNFQVRSTARLLGSSSLVLWDLNFQTADGLTLGYTHEAVLYYNGLDLINMDSSLAFGPVVEKIVMDGKDGFRVSGDQRGYIGNSSMKALNSAMFNSLDSGQSWRCELNPADRPVYVWDATTTWNWTISFTNSSVAFAIYSNQSWGALYVNVSGPRQLLNNQPNYIGANDTIELLANGTTPVFRDWNSTATKTSGSGKVVYLSVETCSISLLVGIFCILALA